MLGPGDSSEVVVIRSNEWKKDNQLISGAARRHKDELMAVMVMVLVVTGLARAIDDRSDCYPYRRLAIKEFFFARLLLELSLRERESRVQTNVPDQQ